MKLSDLISDPDVLCALEPDELGLRMLPPLAYWEEHHRSVLLTLDAFLVVVVGDDRGYPGQYPPQDRRRIDEAVREAWAWLEGNVLLIQHCGYVAPHQVRSLTRRARQLAAEPNARKVFAARHLPKDVLDPAIREDVWALYHRGKYDTAILEAMKAVEVATRAAAGYSNADYGVDMVARAFNEKAGPLTNLTVEAGERHGRSDLFAGAIGSYKNPHSHRNVALDDPDAAAEIIMLANHLLRIIDRRKAALP